MQSERRVGVYVNAGADSQELAALRQFAEDRDWPVGRAYSDRDELMRDCERGAVDTVLIWRLGSLANSIQQLIEALERFRQREIEFVSVVEGVDSATATGRLFLAHVAILANCGVHAARGSRYSGPVQVQLESQL